MKRTPVKPDISTPPQKVPSPSERRSRNQNVPSGKVRALVWQRDRGCCVACGRTLTPGSWWSMQHRKARGQGGTNDAFNLVLLCGSATSPGCHRRAEDRDREFNARGYWLNSWEDPATTPVMLFSRDGSGLTVWLTADGKYITESPAGGAA